MERRCVLCETCGPYAFKQFKHIATITPKCVALDSFCLLCLQPCTGLPRKRMRDFVLHPAFMDTL